MSSFKDKNQIIIMYLVFMLGMMFSIIILNRWLVTDLGLLSFGRLWQLYVSYADFGFIKRGLLGSLLSESGINSLFSNEYVFAMFIHHISILILTILIVHYCSSKNIKNFLFIVGIAFSPTFIIYQGYNTGNSDIFVLLIALINILYVKNYIIFSFNIVLGIFLHELFVFTLPAQFFAFYLCNKSYNINFVSFKSIIPTITTIIAILIILFFGNVDMTEIEFKNIMQSKIPNAYMMHSLWSGHWEISSTLGSHVKSSLVTLVSYFKNGKIIFLLPVLFYLTILTLRVLNFVPYKFNKFILILVIMFPIFVSLFAWDFPRWIAMSANMAILITLKLVARDGLSHNKWNIIIAIFCLCAPFGTVVVDQPLPLHQFVIDKLIN